MLSRPWGVVSSGGANVRPFAPWRHIDKEGLTAMTQAASAGVTPSVGARIAGALADSGLTPTQLARELVGPDASQARVNTMRRLLSKWMSGKHSPSAIYVSRLAQILDKPENYFTPSGVVGESPVPAEVEKEAIALV